MERFVKLAPEEFVMHPATFFSTEGCLLSAGAEGDFNMMTIGWGTAGTLWGVPCVSVYVRPTRLTYDFMEKYDRFALSSFAREEREAIKTLGSTSGRDMDKMGASGLSPVFLDGAPGFWEADSILICKKIYRQKMDASLFAPEFGEKTIQSFYTGGVNQDNFHWIYYGQMEAVYRRSK